MASEVITTLFFDFGGVLVDVDSQRAAAAFQARTGMPSEVFFDAFFGDAAHLQFNIATLSVAGYFSHVAQRLPHPAARADLEAAYVQLITPRSDVLQRVARLADRFRLGVITDTDPLHLSVMRGWPVIADRLDPIVTSFAVGCLKPDPRMYAQACQQAGCRPEQAVFFDDREGNVAGARAYGLTAHHIVDRAALDEALARYEACG